MTSNVFAVADPIIVWRCKPIPQTMKDRKTDSERCGIIYEFECPCSSKYLGRTSRYLSDRVKEHVPVWLRSGNGRQPRSQNVSSSIARHLLVCDVANVGNVEQYFKIIHEGFRSSFKAHILEALLISSQSPDLCGQKEGVYNLLLPW